MRGSVSDLVPGGVHCQPERRIIQLLIRHDPHHAGTEIGIADDYST